jgi:hypothetical protein
LADAPRLTVDGVQPRAIALSPHHALVKRRRDLAARLNQRTVRVEEQLGVVQGAAIALVDAD